ncbi:MAG TPA: amidohydrolase family protein [Clostridia bacterium]|nr:amidohydrolase family protein [Clostridia bacterium]
MVIDFHTHCFPNKISNKAIDILSKKSGNILPEHMGDVDSLRSKIKQMGADMAVVQNISTNPKQQSSVNDYAIRINQFENLVSFGSVHPDSPDALAELERIKESGLKGIKFHPDYQGFFVDEKKMIPLYEKAAELGLITLFHSGVDIGYPDPIHCTPKALRSVLHYFYGAPVVAAHMGGWLCWAGVLEHLVGEDIYFDTAYSHAKMPPEWALEIINSHPKQKILLGSDMPWSRTDNEISFIKSLGLSTEHENMILGENAEKLLGLNK